MVTGTEERVWPSVMAAARPLVDENGRGGCRGRRAWRARHMVCWVLVHGTWMIAAAATGSFGWRAGHGPGPCAGARGAAGDRRGCRGPGGVRVSASARAGRRRGRSETADSLRQESMPRISPDCMVAYRPRRTKGVCQREDNAAGEVESDVPEQPGCKTQKMSQPLTLLSNGRAEDHVERISAMGREDCHGQRHTRR